MKKIKLYAGTSENLAVLTFRREMKSSENLTSADNQQERLELVIIF